MMIRKDTYGLMYCDQTPFNQIRIDMKFLKTAFPDLEDVIDQCIDQYNMSNPVNSTTMFRLVKLDEDYYNWDLDTNWIVDAWHSTYYSRDLTEYLSIYKVYAALQTENQEMESIARKKHEMFQELFGNLPTYKF